MIEIWTEIANGEKGTVTLTTFASAMLPIRRGDVFPSFLTSLPVATRAVERLPSLWRIASAASAGVLRPYAG